MRDRRMADLQVPEHALCTLIKDLCVVMHLTGCDIFIQGGVGVIGVDSSRQAPEE